MRRERQESVYLVRNKNRLKGPKKQKPNRDGLQPTSDGLQPNSKFQYTIEVVAVVGNAIVSYSTSSFYSQLISIVH